MNELSDSPVAPALLTLCELFTTELREVRFPDVDGPTLATAVNAVHAAAEQVAQAEAALEAARAALAERQEQLLHKGQRALAYARIYAEDAPELGARLEGLQLPRSKGKGGRPEGDKGLGTGGVAEPVAPRRRGRPPKSASSEGLFQEASAGGEEGASGALV